jgi:NAD(P)-dependent dehydrogenase (short-subunit alcohol dehydrogenase family)
MLARGRGSVLNIASTIAFQPAPGQATYGASKAFVLSYSEALAEEVRGIGVRVAVLCPEATETAFLGATGRLTPRPVMRRISGRLLRPRPAPVTLGSAPAPMTNEIAGQLYLSQNTIRTHMRHIYDKLDAHRRHEAVDRARTLGLLAPTHEKALRVDPMHP